MILLFLFLPAGRSFLWQCKDDLDMQTIWLSLLPVLYRFSSEQVQLIIDERPAFMDTYDVIFFDVSDQQRALWIVFLPVFDDQTLIEIGIAVPAEMKAGIICTDVVSQKAVAALSCLKASLQDRKSVV